MFGLFGGKDWNVVGIIFERPDLYRVNGNRGKGSEAKTIREAVKAPSRPIFWAIIWSTVVPSFKRLPLEGNVPLSHIAELTECPASP